MHRGPGPLGTASLGGVQRATRAPHRRDYRVPSLPITTERIAHERFKRQAWPRLTMWSSSAVAPPVTWRRSVARSSVSKPPAWRNGSTGEMDQLQGRSSPGRHLPERGLHPVQNPARIFGAVLPPARRIGRARHSRRGGPARSKQDDGAQGRHRAATDQRHQRTVQSQRRRMVAGSR